MAATTLDPAAVVLRSLLGYFFQPEYRIGFRMYQILRKAQEMNLAPRLESLSPGDKYERAILGFIQAHAARLRLIAELEPPSDSSSLPLPATAYRLALDLEIERLGDMLERYETEDLASLVGAVNRVLGRLVESEIVPQVTSDQTGCTPPSVRCDLATASDASPAALPEAQASSSESVLAEGLLTPATATTGTRQPAPSYVGPLRAEEWADALDVCVRTFLTMRQDGRVRCRVRKRSSIEVDLESLSQTQRECVLRYLDDNSNSRRRRPRRETSVDSQTAARTGTGGDLPQPPATSGNLRQNGSS
jgi:hypothetical protein